MQMTPVQLAIALVSVLMQSVVMILMVRRKLRSAYPLFYSFLAVNTATVLIGMAVYRYAIGQYFFVYWASSTVLMLIAFGVLYEVFVNLLKPYSALIDLGKMLFIWAALFLLMAGVMTALVTSGSQVSKVRVALDFCDRCVHLMTCGSLFLLVLFEKRLNLSWRNAGMCIALGLGLTSASDLAVSYSQARYPALNAQLASMDGIIFIAILAFWALRLSSREAVPVTSSSSPSRIILQRWNEALIGYRHGDLAFASSSIDSFLPGVEQTVERVLARKMVQ
ncbi:MAG TPA: hypothetical protein VKL99_16045 [Candidatus Angelobacter sp.]|nr:hypothetical protein [Candidatus Angelobacter sp.]